MTTGHDAVPGGAVEAAPAPVWLVRLTLGSLGMATLSVCVLLWAKWGTVLAMGEDIIKLCF